MTEPKETADLTKEQIDTIQRELVERRETGGTDAIEIAKLHEQINELKEAKEQAEKERDDFHLRVWDRDKEIKVLTTKVEELALYDYRQFIPEGSDCVDCRFCDYVDYEDTGYESYYTCPIVGRRLSDIGIRENDCPKPYKGETDV